MEEFAALVEAGWTDAHRAASDGLGPTWWVPGRENGFRIDHVLVRGGLSTRSSTIVTQVGDRPLVKLPGGDEPGLSDHAALVTRLSL